MSRTSRFRKRPYQRPRDKEALATTLRDIEDLIQHRDFAAALARSNQALLLEGLGIHEQSRVLSLVGDSEFKRGRFADSARIYLQAASRCLDHHDLWLRPLIGHVRALLRAPDIDQAGIVARHTVAVAKQKMAIFDEQVRQANGQLARDGRVALPSVPPRVSVVASRFGYLFLQEGEPGMAAEFFAVALDANPKGACRARQGLARVALAMNDPGTALKWAEDSIRRGNFGAKTLSSWPILIEARRRLGGWRIKERLVRGLAAAPSSVRARAVGLIVSELRRHDMRQWREVAARWREMEGGRFHITAAEIAKMELAAAKAETGNTIGKGRAAQALLRIPGISPREWLSATKEYVRTSLWAGDKVNVDHLIGDGVAKFGPSFAAVARHSLALSCMMAKRHDLARPLLQFNIQHEFKASAAWAKSVWALARMEEMVGAHATAAELYRQFFEQEEVPLRFRLRARLLWAESLVASGNTDALLDARPRIDALLDTVEDPEVLLNFARQLATSGASCEDWAEDLLDRGAAVARRQFEQATHPSVAVDILFKLARRQVIDFGRSTDAIALWEELSDEKKMWLWSVKSRFWEYMGCVLEAYLRDDQDERGESFAHLWLDDPSTPAEGCVQVGVPYGRWLLSRSRAATALELFDQLTRVSPSHPVCAEAWYWKALAAHKKGDAAERDRCVHCLRRAQGLNPALQREWHLDAKGLLLAAGLQVESIDPEIVNYTPQVLAQLKEEIEQELGRIP